MNIDAIYGYALVFAMFFGPLMLVWFGGMYVGRLEECRKWKAWLSKEGYEPAVATGGNDVDDFVEGVTRHMREP